MLSPAQLATLKADILADATLAAKPTNSDGHQAVADAYNVEAAGPYWVWRSFVPDSEVYEATTAAPDNTSWSWTIFIGRSQGERDAWRQMVNMKGGINASLANVRQAVGDIFSGAGGLAQRTHLLALGRRKATRAEKLFAVATAGGSGTRGSTANPDTTGLDGPLSASDVETARNLP